MLLMPHVAHAVLAHSEQVGLFLGLAVHDTAQVVGSALTYKTMFGDDLALRVAIVTKLTRNLFLAAAIPGLIALNARAEARLAAERAAQAAAAGPGAPGSAEGRAGAAVATGLTAGLSLSKLKTYVPPFVVGFLAMAALRSTGDAMLASGHSALGLCGAAQWAQITSFVGGTLGSHYLLGTAMAAVGLSTSLASLRGVGPRPFLVGFAGAAAVSSAGMACALALPYLADLPPAV